MNNTFMDRGPYIAVAVGFDQHTLPLTKAAWSLCRLTGKSLCLLHVVEPWMEASHSRAFGEDDPLWNVTQAVERDAKDVAQSKLEELRSTLGQEVTVTTRVVSGKPAEVLGVEALSAGACLLLVGARFDSLRFMPRGFSTALSLVVSSPVPVMVVDTTETSVGAATTAGVPFAGERPQVLIADDLGDQSEAAVEFAFAFGAALAKADIHHIHVNGLTLGSLKAGIETAAASSHTLVDPDTSAERVYAALIDDLEAKLHARAENHLEYLEAAGGTYTAEVLTGNVTDELSKRADSLQPDVLIFGRHRAYYTKPFFIGRLPFRAMLQFKRPILVVPHA